MPMEDDDREIQTRTDNAPTEALILSYAAPDSGSSSILPLLLRPIGWPTIAAAVFMMLSFAWANRLPLADVRFQLLGLLLGLVVVGSWLPRVVIQMVVAVRMWMPPTAAVIRGWITPPLVLAMTILLLWSEIPLGVSIAVSRPAMDRLVQQVSASGGAVPNRARAGLFTALWIEEIPGGIRFLAEGSGFFRAAGGFAYSPDGPPPQADMFDQYTPIGDGWYLRRWIKP
jgi:hypothetical protein